MALLVVRSVFPLDYHQAAVINFVIVIFFSKVTPIIKKSSLDPDVLKNYRPVSNLHYISKLTEKVWYGIILFGIQLKHL